MRTSEVAKARLRFRRRYLRGLHRLLQFEAQRLWAVSGRCIRVLPIPRVARVLATLPPAPISDKCTDPDEIGLVTGYTSLACATEMQ